jgi:hypothetical protein
MSPDISIPSVEQERKPFPELELDDFSNSFTIQLIPNGQFTEEQIYKIIEISEFEEFFINNEWIPFYLLKHITFALENNPNSTYLCLAHPDKWEHHQMYYRIKKNLGDLILKDAGLYGVNIDTNDHFLFSDFSESLSKEICKEDCLVTRNKISAMNIGIGLLE